MFWFVSESVWWTPVIDPAALASITRIGDRATISLMTQHQPNASIDMVSVNHTKNKTSKYSEVTLSLFAEILEHELQDELLWLGQSVDVEDPNHFEQIIINTLSRI